MANNILFILTDQERYFSERNEGLRLPGRERLAAEGVTFDRHYIASTLCTSSRSVIYTGQHMPVTRMFDNVTFPFVDSLSPNLPTMGTRFRRAGYETAYKGKWHLTSEFEPNPETSTLHVHQMERYGFSDWNPAGDITGDPWDGYKNDLTTAAAASEWLRTKGTRLGRQGTPWLLAVNLVNPHDVMYYDTDLPGELVQTAGLTLMDPHQAPDHDNYNTSYPKAPIPPSWNQPIDEDGRPAAHAEYQAVMSHVLGPVPPEAARWERFRDYYFNCIAEVDRKIQFLLDELEALGLLDSTVVVLTSDHGEMQGAHGLRGKGGNAYEESIHVPLIARIPDGPRGAACSAVTSHVDVLPTLIGLADLPDATRTELTAGLPGQDASHTIGRTTDVGIDAVRDAAIFAASNAIFLEGDFVGNLVALKAQGYSHEEIQAQLIAPKLTNRCLIRTVIDGRYKLSRYFAPLEHHRTNTVQELFEHNDVELFDLFEDPGEMCNLAGQGDDHRPVVEELNKKLTHFLDAEIGVHDDGRYLPSVPGMSWAAPELTNI